jgi:hypothetical protein
MTGTIAAIVVCVAGLLGETPPADAQGIVTPIVRLVSPAQLARPVPRGWDARSWSRRGGGRFTRPPRQSPRNALIEIDETRHRDGDILLAHEVAHFVLWANGREWRHLDDNGRRTDVDRLVAWVERKFRRHCAGAATGAPA